MKRICVLGGGQQGSVIATDLDEVADVTVYDLRRRKINGKWCQVADLSDYRTLVNIMHDYKHQVVVGALPAELGFQAARAAVEAGCHYIDIAYYREDAYDLNARAFSKGLRIIPDCGFAPGISNLIVGQELGPELTEIHIKVGGFSKDPNAPYGYVNSWSLEDLLDEYVRPARIIVGGEITTIPALCDVKSYHVEGIGELEAFYTDGLRTLLDLRGSVRTLTEKTLRWPGHVDQIKPLIANGTFIQEFKDKCSQGNDIGVMVVEAVKGCTINKTTVISRAGDGLSAMARATALTCATVTRFISEHGQGNYCGVRPLEWAEPELYDYVMERLQQVGIEIKKEIDVRESIAVCHQSPRGSDEVGQEDPIYYASQSSGGDGRGGIS